MRSSHALPLLAACLFGLGATPLVAQSPSTTLSPRDIAALARPGVVLIQAFRDGEEISQGSGFLVRADGHLVTNHHVVEGADRLAVTLSTGEIYDRVWLVSHDRGRDLVILRIAGVDFPVLALGDDRAIEVGDPIYVMGNPLGLDGTFSDGLVSAKRTADGVSYIQISAPISPGSSGGPVLNDRAEVVGIATLTLQDGQNLNLAVPVRYAGGLLALEEPPIAWEQAWPQLAAADDASLEGHAGDDYDQGYDDGDYYEEPLEPWAQVLLDEMAAIDDAAVAIGAVQTHDPVIEMLNEGDTHVIEYEFPKGGVRVALIGVCDLDCLDLDIGVYDEYGNEIAIDVTGDDRPEVNIDILQPSRLEVRVFMAQCSVQPCGFAIQAYELATPAGAPAKKT